MATSFSSLPLVDLAVLSTRSPKTDDLHGLSKQLHDVFSTTGFAYLINPPLSFSHADVFALAKEFFALPKNDKLKLAKRNFVKGNLNTYRGYFPAQPGQQDNLKEGFEIGPVEVDDSFSKQSGHSATQRPRIELAESNTWPSPDQYPSSSRQRLKLLYSELQNLSAMILSLLAVALGQRKGFFDHYLENSLSTLRLLHYPPQQQSGAERKKKPTGSASADDDVKLCCTPHTDSGILTLLHQDSTGGLEVRNSDGHWVAAPYVPESIVVNIGDLMAEVSGGRYVATVHRVRVPQTSSSSSASGQLDGVGRLSVPFFFEPGEQCVVTSVDQQSVKGILYGDHVRGKMKTWVEFQDVEEVMPATAFQQPIGTVVDISA